MEDNEKIPRRATCNYAQWLIQHIIDICKKRAAYNSKLYAADIKQEKSYCNKMTSRS